jgi:hypothetical protein
MNKGKPDDPIEIDERKDLQERDDELTGEKGMGPGANAQIAQFSNEEAETRKKTTKSQSPGGKSHHQ